MASAQVQLPHDLQAILEEEDSQIDDSFHNLNGQLKDETVIIPAKQLTIFKGHDPSCWKWTCEGAELLCIDVLDVSKKYPVQELSAGNNYVVYFRLKMKDAAFGFQGHPMTFKLVVPDQSATEHKQDLPKKKWVRVPVGMFYRDPKMTGDLEISMFEHGSQSKGGLIVNKLVIRKINLERG